MSGSAGLAAARRRRAGGGNTNPPVSNSPNPKQEPPKASLHPVQILQHHDKQILVLTNEVDKLKSQQKSPITSDDIEFYKEKYNTLLSEMTEMKTNFVKMQTFCMETNLKLEAKLNSNTDNE